MAWGRKRRKSSSREGRWANVCWCIDYPGCAQKVCTRQAESLDSVQPVNLDLLPYVDYVLSAVGCHGPGRVRETHKQHMRPFKCALAARFM